MHLNLWQLYLEQEFVYVGDEAIIEPSGRTRRQGAELAGRYQISRAFFANLDASYSRPRLLDAPEGEDFVPLAPNLVASGGLAYAPVTGFNVSLRGRYLADRPANETNTLTAPGYFLVDLVSSFRKKKWEIGASIQNLLNTEWNETQFETTSRLAGEPAPVTEIHLTPGTPFFLRGWVSVLF